MRWCYESRSALTVLSLAVIILSPARIALLTANK